MLWAREMRGSSSRAKAVIFLALSAASRALSSNGLSRPIRVDPAGSAAISSGDGGVTRAIRPAPPYASRMPPTRVISA
jgi:hypothetical protein